MEQSVESVWYSNGAYRDHYSLPSEAHCRQSGIMALAQGFDGLVLIPNCDKIVPGMLMGQHD